jgi:hypothetical protein
MAAPAAPTLAAPAPAGPVARRLPAMVLRVAWLAIGLGAGVELLLLLLNTLTRAGGSAAPFAADLPSKVSWSFIVCVGLALGATASRARAGVMGLLGLISAPAGFIVARAVHQMASQALDLAPAGGGGASPILLAAIKGVEYAILGALLGWLSRRGSGFAAHAAAGGVIAVTFGVLLVALQVSPAVHPSVAAVAGKAINELLFPVGCALAIYAAAGMEEHLGLR